MNIHNEINKFDGGSAHFHVEMLDRPGKNTSILHYHDCVEILYALTGQIEVTINECQYLANPHDMIVVLNDEAHRIRTLSAGENSYMVLKYDPEILFSTSQSATETKFLVTFASAALVHNRVFTAEVLKDTPIPRIIEELMEENETGEFGSEIALRLGLCQLYLWILRSWKQQDNESALMNINNIDVINTLQKIYDIVDNEYMNKITVETVAGRLGMSYYSFSKFFTAHGGKSFPRYLNEVRLTKSKILLTTTGMNITEIALEVGFISSSHFIQRFKESNQMTPQQFKKEFLK